MGGAGRRRRRLSGRGGGGPFLAGQKCADGVERPAVCSGLPPKDQHPAAGTGHRQLAKVRSVAGGDRGFPEKNQTEKEQRIRNASKAFFLCAWVPMGFLFAQTFGKVYGQAFSGDAAQIQREMEAMLEFTITVVGYAIALGVAAIGISWVVTSALQVSVAGKINQKQCVVAYLKEMRYQASGETGCPRRQTRPRARGRARRKNTRGGPLPGVE